MSSSGAWLDDALIQRALAEDIGRGDFTTLACIPSTTSFNGQIIAKQNGVIAGLPLAARVFQLVDPSLTIQVPLADGSPVTKGQVVLMLQGSAQSALTAERTALNFLGRLSGIATLTAQCVAAITGTDARIVDTRKTTPGLRLQEKYAVTMGGGANHRFGLDDGILIKDNHIVASGGIAAAIRLARQSAHHLLRIEIECDTIEQVSEVLEVGGVDVILLDNMPIEMLTQAVQFIRSRQPTMLIEASGGMGTDARKLRSVAVTGVDLISIGALTHSAPNFDVSLEFLPT